MTTTTDHGGFTGTHPELFSTSGENSRRREEHPRGFGTKSSIAATDDGNYGAGQLTCRLTTDPDDDAPLAVGKDKALGCAA